MQSLCLMQLLRSPSIMLLTYGCLVCSRSVCGLNPGWIGELDGNMFPLLSEITVTSEAISRIPLSTLPLLEMPTVAPTTSHQAQALVSAPCSTVLDVQTDRGEREAMPPLREDLCDIRKPPGSLETALRTAVTTPFRQGPLSPQEKKTKSWFPCFGGRNCNVTKKPGLGRSPVINLNQACQPETSFSCLNSLLGRVGATCPNCPTGTWLPT